MMIKTGVITSLLALTFGTLQAQQGSLPPRLVVMLTIDQLRSDYQEGFAALYGEKGFKRLLREGRVYAHADIPFGGADRSSAVAAIYSGTTPSLNGIIGNYRMDVGSLQVISCVDDTAFMGNYTNENSAPTQLLTSTLTDELKIATEGKGQAFAIAPTRDAAILSAGHAADGAFWLNSETGKWCGTTYYTEFPWWLSQYNDNASPDHRIATMVWEPTRPAEAYTFLPDWRGIPFKYILESERQNKYRRLIASPLINDEVNSLAEELIDKSSIGIDRTPDLLALTYYAGNYNHRSVQECAMEMQDTYVRLDRSIGDLLDMLDRKVGLQNVLLCVASTGYADPDDPDLGLYRTPGGEFHLNRCATLLNMYLMATYGEGQYVEAYYNQQIYLNHQLIEQKSLDLAEIQERSAAFLMQFSGVNEAYSAHRLLLGSWSPRVERIRGSFHRKLSGDLYVDVLPGWPIVEQNPSDNRTVRSTPLTAPLIFWGAGVKAAVVPTPISILSIAPTLTGAMRIRAPSAATADALSVN
jgi:hypothetical protein